ncbi:helix-turn-helix domain-containing protein [Mycolicibacterium thermoresistibile]|uniref:helix-turn-helix domain-containing protein n=1 Tax=Mycolicibacterium thermoresistibile TaxID=1797 RepID=UPI0009DA2809|nr:helix-turn-helix transcriptional regulator [Mycolicibacterium thermoresistibile]MCV7186995.1 helix-turn-helix transcriptional regulator [Mycolicibacterium thermoresistibile]
MPCDSQSQRVAANVRAEMARTKRTQSALAHSIGMKQQALSRRLSGRTPFTVDEIAEIARCLDVPVAALFATEPVEQSA